MEVEFACFKFKMVGEITTLLGAVDMAHGHAFWNVREPKTFYKVIAAAIAPNQFSFVSSINTIREEIEVVVEGRAAVSEVLRLYSCGIMLTNLNIGLSWCLGLSQEVMRFVEALTLVEFLMKTMSRCQFDKERADVTIRNWNLVLGCSNQVPPADIQVSFCQILQMFIISSFCLLIYFENRKYI